MKILYKIYLSISILLVISVTLFSQDKPKEDSTIVKNDNVKTFKPVQALKTPRLNYSMELGAGYVSGGNLFSGTYTNIAPSINYLVTPKLKIEVGGIFSTGNTNFSQNSVIKPGTNLSLNTNQYFVYTQGSYSLSNKLVVSGSFYTTLNSNKSTQINPYFLDYKGMNFGLDYKIGKNMSIGAQIRLSNGNNNYLFDQTSFGSLSHYGHNNLDW
jgi:hypothetical protein